MSAGEERSAAKVLRYPPGGELRDEIEDLFDDIVNGLGCIEPGFGEMDYRAAMKAVARLREILGLNDA